MKKIGWLFICTVFFLPQISNAENQIKEQIYKKMLYKEFNSKCLTLANKMGDYFKSNNISIKDACHCFSEDLIDSIDRYGILQEVIKNPTYAKSKEVQKKIRDIGELSIKYCVIKLL